MDVAFGHLVSWRVRDCSGNPAERKRKSPILNGPAIGVVIGMMGQIMTEITCSDFFAHARGIGAESPTAGVWVNTGLS